MSLLQRLFTIALSVVPAYTNNCRCTFGTACWPSDADFESLASQVSQPLIHPAPPATPCYNPSSGNCSDVRAGWFNGIWRSDQSGAAEHTNFETFTFPNGTIEACYLNTTLAVPCQQGNVPVIGVDARTPEDIQAAVKFASKHNLRLVIKNTGHDYLGRSSGRGSFVIWTHHLKNTTFHDSFSPKDAPNSVKYDNVFTFGAGIQWFEAYQAGKLRNRVLVGGYSPTGSVGATGGWLQGGGHSALSPNYGLGVDNVVQFTIVTADGNHVVANAYCNEDLFWALRGGGGGTWGVVTSVSYKTHPSIPFAATFLSFNSTDAKSTQNVFTEVVRLTPSLVEHGYGGYSSGSVHGYQFFVTSPNVTQEENQAIFNPLFELAHSQPGLSVQNATALFSDWWQWYNFISSLPTQVLVGVPTELSSWLLPTDLFEAGKPEHVAAQLLQVESGFFGYFLITGGQVSRVDPESTGLNPVWRKSMAYVTLGTSWEDGADSTEIEAARQVLIHDMKLVESLAPESGAYLNEASRYELDWKKSFFGTHYDKLRSIKRKYDPQSLFLIHEGIASDEWDANLVCRV